MNSTTLSSILLACLIVIITRCELIEANEEIGPIDDIDGALELNEQGVDGGAIDHAAWLRQSFLAEYNAHPHLYDPLDVEYFLNDPMGIEAIKYLNQRSYDIKRAYKLVVSTLRWRASMNLSKLDPSMFPCELFNFGLIFEEGRTHQRHGPNMAGNPVIWIRLGALGGIVRDLEHLGGRRVASFAFNTAKSAAYMTRKKARQARNSISRRQHVSRHQSKTPLIANMSVKNNNSIQQILRAMAWWLEDWRKRHEPGTKATLVLDFEGNDFAFSSWSMGEFFVKLDDHFPDLFEQIIGFRFKPKFWSLHGAISMFNRIFKSRLSSAVETDAKLKFVEYRPQMSQFMPVVDANGMTMLPQYVSGRCTRAKHIPAGCQEDTNAMIASGMLDGDLFNALHNEFNQFCKRAPKKISKKGPKKAVRAQRKLQKASAI